MSMIDISAVEKRYGKTLAVRGIDCTIEAGEFVVILGPSGCGKSTLLRMIAGLEEITAGTVSIDGAVVNDMEPGERGCAMVFQNYALYPHMTVAQNIGYALKVAGVPKAERQKKVAAIAEMLELGKLLERKPGELSGGQRQRVAMGRAMIRSPKVFLFDEPLSNLDARLRLQMRLEIRRLHRELRTTSIFVTHDQVEAMTLADKLVVMSDGRIEQIGSPAEVYQRPASRFVAGFLGAPPMNMFPGEIDQHGRAVLADGSQLSPSIRWALPKGEEVVLGVRPSALQLVQPGTAGALPFTLDMHEDLGGEFHLHGAAADTPVAVALAGGMAVPDGPLHILAPSSALHLFVARCGRRVEPITEPSVQAPTIPLEGESTWNARQYSSI